MCEARERGDLAFFVVEIDAEEIDANGLSSAMRKGIESVMSAIGNYALAGQILQKVSLRWRRIHRIGKFCKILKRV